MLVGGVWYNTGCSVLHAGGVSSGGSGSLSVKHNISRSNNSPQTHNRHTTTHSDTHVQQHTYIQTQGTSNNTPQTHTRVSHQKTDSDRKIGQIFL